MIKDIKVMLDEVDSPEELLKINSEINTYVSERSLLLTVEMLRKENEELKAEIEALKEEREDSPKEHTEIA